MQFIPGNIYMVSVCDPLNQINSALVVQSEINLQYFRVVLSCQLANLAKHQKFLTISLFPVPHVQPEIH